MLNLLGMSVLYKYAIEAYIAYCHIFAYFSKVCTSHIFPHKLAFSTALLMLFVFLLPISIRFPYLDHLVASRMAPSQSRPLRNDRVVGFKQFCTIFLSHIWCLCGPHIFLKMPHKTDMPNLQGSDTVG